MVGEALTIGELAAATGVSVATLRTWEARHRFPCPTRLQGGHRRYTPGDVELIRHVLGNRSAGLSLEAAIARATTAPPRSPTVFAAIREAQPEIAAQLMPRSAMIALSHAIEDECLARATQPVLIGSFQRERFYRRAQPRWRELARTARRAVVMADFPETVRPAHTPIEVPVPQDSAMRREWAVICVAPNLTACLSGWEPPSEQVDGPAAPRRYEAVISIEPRVVAAAASAACEVIHRVDPEIAELLREDSTFNQTPTDGHLLRSVAALQNRLLAYLLRPPGA